MQRHATPCNAVMTGGGGVGFVRHDVKIFQKINQQIDSFLSARVVVV